MSRTDIDGGGSALEGEGSTDGDSSGLFDMLEFGVALGGHPTTALMGGAKSVNKDGTTPIDTLGARAINISTEVTDSTYAATGDEAILIGQNSRAIAPNSICIGANNAQSSSAPHTGYINIGNGNSSIGINALVIGQSATGAQSSVSLGQSASVSSGTNGVAIGTSSNVTAQYGVAIGALGATAAEVGVALGSGTSASAKATVAIGGDVLNGQGARATATSAIAIGGDDGSNPAAIASNTYSISIGTDSTCAGNSGVALGRGADCATSSSIAVGAFATANTANAGVALGASAVASASQAIVVGSGNALATRSIVIGNGNAAAGQSDIVALGANADVDNSGAVAIGSRSTLGAQVTANGGIAIGGSQNTTSLAAQCSGLAGVAIGGGSGTSGEDGASVTANFGIAIGNDSVASASRAVQIGAGTNSIANSCQIGSSATPLEIFLNLPVAAGTSGSLWNNAGVVSVAP